MGQFIKTLYKLSMKQQKTLNELIQNDLTVKLYFCQKCKIYYVDTKMGAFPL